MTPVGVVETVDVLGYRAPGSACGWSQGAVDEFGFQSAEETFDHRTVPAISFATHAALHSVMFEQRLILAVAKKLSATALFQQLGFRLMLAVTS